MKLEALAVSAVLAAGTALAAPSNAMADKQNGLGAGQLAEVDMHRMPRRSMRLFCLPILCGPRDCMRHVKSKHAVRGSQGSTFCKFCPQKDCGDHDKDEQDEDGRWRGGEELDEGPGRGFLPFPSGSQQPPPPDPDDAPPPRPNGPPPIPTWRPDRVSPSTQQPNWPPPIPTQRPNGRRPPKQSFGEREPDGGM